RALSGGLDLGARTFTELGRATSGGHLQMYSTDASHQNALTKLGLDWGLSRAKDATDVLGVYTLNADASKQDYFLRKDIEYTVTLDPDRNTARGELEVTLRDTMPATGEPSYVMGPGYRGTPPLDNRMGVAIVKGSGSQARQITEDGAPLPVEMEQDGDQRAHLGYTVVPNGRTKPIRAVFETSQAMEGDGSERIYRLRLLNQPTLLGGRYYVRISAPAGWTVEQRMLDGIQLKDEVIEVRLTRSWWRGLFG
ncbi:MAG: hypothetical protein ACREA0_00395, partial [bacterium]